MLSALPACAPSVQNSRLLKKLGDVDGGNAERVVKEQHEIKVKRAAASEQAYITKPIRPNKLFAAIESVLAAKLLPAGVAEESRK